MRKTTITLLILLALAGSSFSIPATLDMIVSKVKNKKDFPEPPKPSKVSQYLQEKHLKKCAINALLMTVPIVTIILDGFLFIAIPMLALKIKSVLHHCGAVIFYEVASPECANRVRIAKKNFEDNWADEWVRKSKDGLKMMFKVLLGDL